MKSVIIIFFEIFVVSVLSLLIFSVYLNQKAGENFIKSKVIVINPDSRKCDLTNINNNIVLDSSNVYKNESLLSFDTTTDSSKAGNYLTICNETCSERGVTNGCKTINLTYKKCIKLLEPPQGCTNNSKPLGLNEKKVIYATKISSS